MVYQDFHLVRRWYNPTYQNEHVPEGLVMIPPISHERSEEEPMAKARWFQSLTVEERAELLCSFTDLILEINPGIVDKKYAQPVAGRFRILKQP
jgi:hypothetical protein